MTKAQHITVAYGDGIGPEIMDATLAILQEAGAQLSIDTIEIGEKLYEKGVTTGIPPYAWKTLKRNKILLKAPITTPQGGGYKSLNVTMRKTLGLYANVRPSVCYHPFVATNHPDMNLVIVRENEEDLYAGIEYRQSQDAVQCLKIITRSASERIIRYAFEYAVKNGRNKVTCMSKDNIMKMTDGLFHKTFDEVKTEYPNIETDHYIIDIGAARIGSKPELFDVIVTENLYGDIVSDIAAEVSGSVGLAGSSNIGDDFAMFEAIHGSAPDISGKGIANPSGLLHGAIMMLVHIGQGDVATKIHNAWLRTIEDGIHTGDIYGEHSTKKVGTKDFAEAVMERIGQEPQKLKPVKYANKKVESGNSSSKLSEVKPEAKTLVGVDVYVDWTEEFSQLVEKLHSSIGNDMKLHTIASKGLKVWPEPEVTLKLTDQYCCRVMPQNVNAPVTHGDVATLLGRMAEAGLDFIKTEHLYNFDGKRGYTIGQGE
ncbi:MAG: NADP-dependent isocitrate dehydrogenase [Alphaproteobacteria bacterium]|nr:NADP-dependent isocitrate dehydrogenase [Alphaproteobacteria bacterium]